jgi:hypothetical protein
MYSGALRRICEQKGWNPEEEPLKDAEDYADWIRGREKAQLDAVMSKAGPSGTTRSSEFAPPQ